MPKYTLKYFNVKGLAEPIRYLFAWSGVDFVDERMERDNWLTVKAEQPFGQLPVLDAGGAMLLSQSVAIARYLGRTFGLSADDDVKNAQLDALVDHMNDIHKKQYAVMNTGVGGEELMSTTLPFYLEKFNSIASEGWFYGSTGKSASTPLRKFDMMKLAVKANTERASANQSAVYKHKPTWVDIYFVGFIDTLETRLKTEILAAYPNLNQIKKKVSEKPSVQKYLEKRPYCDK